MSDTNSSSTQNCLLFCGFLYIKYNSILILLYKYL